MQPRAFIIHGWDGYPEEGCFPWLKKELEKRGFAVRNPAMPDPLRPRIETWVSYLAEQVGNPDDHTVLVGHSIGAQTVLRYLASLPEDAKAGKVILLAGFVHLTDEAYETDKDKEIAKPWLENPIDWENVKLKAGTFTAIVSDNDPLVPISDSEIFKKNLGADIIVEHNKGHFSGSDGIRELPSLLSAIIEEPGRKLHRCPECGLRYAEKEWAEKCERWCRTHKSCNLEITAHAVQAEDGGSPNG